MMEGWDLLCSLHIKVNVIGTLGRGVLQEAGTRRLRSMESVEQAHGGSGAIG